MTKYELENMIEEKEFELENLKKQLRDIKREEAKKEFSEVRQILFNHMEFIDFYDGFGNEYTLADVIICDNGRLEICLR